MTNNTKIALARIPLTLAVCFCNTPPHRLQTCLENLQQQDYPALQILLVDDSSLPDSERDSLIQSFLDSDSRFCYVTHDTNLGTLEARRTSVECATGDYLFWIDDDDFLASPVAMTSLASIAQTQDYDVIQALFSTIDTTGANQGFKKAFDSFASGIFMGPYIAKNLLDFFFVQHQTNSLACGKLIRTSILRRAFQDIPSFFCTLQESLLISFFTALHAKTYYGYDQKIYQYNLGDGITTKKDMLSLSDFEKKHLNTLVYTVIYEWLQTNNASEDLCRAMDINAYTIIKNNLKLIESRITLDKRAEARRIVCESWGEAIVQKVEEAMRG